jgi:hypothetical protein
LRGKKYLWTLFIVMFLAGMAKVSIPATSSPTVTFRVDPVITPGVAVDGVVWVNVYIDADPGAAIVGWAIDIKVDPAVLKPGYNGWVAWTGTPGYFLYDWCDANDWRYPGDTEPTLIFDPTKNETSGTITDYAETIKLWRDLGVGVGADGNGPLATFYFTSKSETAYSPIEITKAYYYTSWNSPDVDERVPDLVINGHYNVPEHDVAVTDVSAPPEATFGDLVSINVSIWNLGANNETFNLTVSYDATIIENRSVSLTSNATGTESFTWNTAGVDPGNYTITAKVILATDVDPSNDERTTTILLVMHDLAVISVTPSVSEAYPTWTVQVNVTVLNNSTLPINCTVAAYYNASTWYEIGTQNVTLAEDENTTLTFNWNLTDVPYHNRTVKTNATLIGLDDMNPGNNEFVVYDAVKVKMVGDVNGNNYVGSEDLFALAPAYGSHPGDEYWNRQCDFNDDSYAGSMDLFILAANYGESY